MQSRKPNIRITYQNRDITKDVTPLLVSVDYVDSVKGRADTVELVFDDTDLVWQSTWYPEKGDTIKLEIGYESLVDCGTFQVDEIGYSINPDQITIRGISAPVSVPLRTRRVRAYEKQTLAKIAKSVAAANGLTLFGNIAEILIERVTQNQETDLGFLARVAGEYGYVFSVKSGKLVFTNIYDLENSTSALSLSRADLTGFSVTDKLTKVYKSAQTRYHDPVTGKFVQGESSGDGESNDDLETWEKAENQGQAQAKAKSHLHDANTLKVEGSFTAEGNPYLLAGNNIELTGFGVLSGVYHIISSTHNISAGGYTTSCEVKRVKLVDAEKQKTKISRNRFNFIQ